MYTLYRIGRGKNQSHGSLAKEATGLDKQCVMGVKLISFSFRDPNLDSSVVSAQTEPPNKTEITTIQKS